MTVTTRKRPRTIWIVLGVLFLIWLVIQIVPLSRDNPAIASEVMWDSPETRTLAKNACFDCHSNETVWPWYSQVSPSKLLVWFDVHAGRQTLNFSDWEQASRDVDDIADVIQRGEMPPFYYTLLHPEARLSEAEKQTLIDGLRATLLLTEEASLDSTVQPDSD